MSKANPNTSPGRAYRRTARVGWAAVLAAVGLAGVTGDPSSAEAQEATKREAVKRDGAIARKSQKLERLRGGEGLAPALVDELTRSFPRNPGELKMDAPLFQLRGALAQDLQILNHVLRLPAAQSHSCPEFPCHAGTQGPFAIAGTDLSIEKTYLAESVSDALRRITRGGPAPKVSIGYRLPLPRMEVEPMLLGWTSGYYLGFSAKCAADEKCVEETRTVGGQITSYRATQFHQVGQAFTADAEVARAAYDELVAVLGRLQAHAATPRATPTTLKKHQRER